VSNGPTVPVPAPVPGSVTRTRSVEDGNGDGFGKDLMKRLASRSRGHEKSCLRKRPTRSWAQWRPAMDHVAIDLGGRESQICVRNAAGAIVSEERCSTSKLRGVLAKLPPGRVVVETCAEAFAVADAAQDAGHQVRVVPSMLARALGVGMRGLKNDVRDARNLSEASCRMEHLPSVHVPTQNSRDRKSMCALREGLISSRTKLVNGVRGWLRGQGIGVLRSGAVETLPARLRKHLEVKDRSAPPYVDRNLAAIEMLNQQIHEADKELELVAAKDPTVLRLMSVPGVGALTAVRFVAAIDDVSRFSTAHSLESYLGLTPGEMSSSDKRRTTGITKAGSKQARWALVQAAWAARRSAGNHPLVRWALEVEARRGKKVAILALARKMAGILYALWRDGTTYNPLHASRPGSEGSMVVPAAPSRSNVQSPAGRRSARRLQSPQPAR
jgi:transposase